MPITPNETFKKRHEASFAKLCDLIDKKLQESEGLPFNFTFLPNTSPNLISDILAAYRGAGWVASVAQKSTDKGESSILTLTDEANRPLGISLEDSAIEMSESAPASVEELKNAVIKAALSSPPGAYAIAHAMRDPMYMKLQYMSVARRVFMQDELQKPDDYACYDIGCDSLYYASDGLVKKYDRANFGNINDFHSFMAAHSINRNELSDTSTRNLLDKSQSQISDSLLYQEQVALFRLFYGAAGHDQTIHTYSETLSRAVLDSMGALERYEVPAAHLCVNPLTFRTLYSKFLDMGFAPSEQDKSIYRKEGDMLGMEVYLCSAVEPFDVFITPEAKSTGVLSQKCLYDDADYKGYMEVLSSFDDEKIGFMATVKESLILMNTQMVRKVSIRL